MLCPRPQSGVSRTAAPNSQVDEPLPPCRSPLWRKQVKDAWFGKEESKAHHKPETHSFRSSCGLASRA